MHSIILAGGFATRLWPLTEKTPKPLVLVGGKPLLSHIVNKIPKNIPIILSVNSAFANSFREWKSKYQTDKRQIEIFVEDANSEGEKLGALFAISKCIQEQKINDDIMILAGDNFFDFEITNFINNFQKNPLIAVFDIKDKNEAKKFGVIVPNLEKGKLVKNFEEKPNDPKSTLVSTGCSIIPKNLFKKLHKFAETHKDDLGKIFEHFLNQGEIVEYFDFNGKWFDIGDFRAFLEAHKAICGDKVICENNVKEENVEYTGSVFIGKNSFIKNAVIENSVILPGVKIKNAEVRNSVIGKNATLINVDLDWKILRDEGYISVE